MADVKSRPESKRGRHDTDAKPSQLAFNQVCRRNPTVGTLRPYR
jgi:hypothetical protein